MDDFPAATSGGPMRQDFFRAMPPAQAQLHQRFFQRPLSLTTPDRAWTLEWSPLSAADILPACPYAMALVDQASPLHILFVLPQLPEVQRIQLAAQQQHPHLIQAACCQILSPLLEALQAKAQAHFHAQIYWQPNTAPEPQGLPLQCRLTGSDGAPICGLTYFLHADSLPQTFFHAEPGRPAKTLGLDWPCPVQLACGHQALSYDELSALEPGDAIFLADAKPGQKKIYLTLPGHSARWSGELDNDGFHVQVKEEHMVNYGAGLVPPVVSEAELQQPAMLEEIDSIPITLSFSLGTCEKTFADIAQLQPGYVLPLPADFDQRQVAILANGRKIGWGELIVVGDRLAVQIDQWQVQRDA